MTKNTPDPSVPLLDRLDALLISSNRANALVGRKVLGDVTFEESEQNNSRRKLLKVEEAAVQKKMDTKQATAEITEKVSKKLHDNIRKEMQPLIEDGDFLFNKALSLNEGIVPLLDTLSSRACTVPKLEPLVAEFPWMQDDVLRAVNTSEHRRMDEHGRAIKVESVRTALGYLGLDNLKKLIPFMVVKHALPKVTDPYPQIKLRLSEYFIAIANTSYVIAEQRGQPPFAAYVLGLFSGLGLCATWRQFFKVYDSVISEMANRAVDRRDKDTYSALQMIQPSATSMSELRELFEKQATSNIIEKLEFKRININAPWTDPSSPMAKTLACAQQYAMVKMLIRFKLIEKSEVKEALSNLNLTLTRKEFEIVSKMEIFRIQAQKYGG